MFKLKFIIPFLILTCLVLINAGCGKQEQKLEKDSGGTNKTESLTKVLGKAKDIIAYKYDTVMTAPGESAITAKLWLKEDKMRWEGVYEGKNVVYLIDQSKQATYLYIPAQKMAMKMNFGEAQETVGESPTEQSGSIEQYNPTTLGTEVIDGKTCLVIEYANEAGKTKIWVWTKYGIPIRTETVTAKGTAVIEIKNIEFGDISDSMFELPAGVQPITIPNFGL